MPTTGSRSATRSGAGQVIRTAPSGALPAGSTSRRRTIEVPAGSGCCAARTPRGTAGLRTACGDGIPGTEDLRPGDHDAHRRDARRRRDARLHGGALSGEPVERAAGAAEAHQEETGVQDRERLAAELQLVPEGAARRADRDVAQRAGGGAPVLVRGLEQLRAHALAVGGARLAVAHEVRPRAEDEALRRLRRDAELGRDLLVREAVELAPHERVALLVGQRREVVEEIADAGAAVGGMLGLAPGRARRARPA